MKQRKVAFVLLGKLFQGLIVLGKLAAFQKKVKGKKKSHKLYMVNIIHYLIGLAEGMTAHMVVNIKYDNVMSLAPHLILSRLLKLVTAILFSTEQIVV